MLNGINDVKKKLDEAISQLCKMPHMFSKNPDRDFTRTRKLPLQKVISILLAMEGRSLTSELLNYFGCSPDVASSSAFVQQRGKINSALFPCLFNLFVQKTDSDKRYKGLRLFAADGSDMQIPTTPDDADTFFPGINGRAPFSLLHIDAMYDLLQHTYIDTTLHGKKKANERRTLCTMVDHSELKNVLLIADRGYENYNLMAHIQEKGWFFLIRIKEASSRSGIAAGLELPPVEEFDLFIDLSLTARQTNEVKLLCKDKNRYKMLDRLHDFDYLPLENNKKHDPILFYKLPFRIVRFKISPNTYETVVTNLDLYNFPPDELKKLYNMRWGIETSFRELKYTLGLLHFHAKKVEYIYQEIFARLIMYNFSEMITSHIIISKIDLRYAYKANFSVAVHLCRQFFLGNVSPPNLEAIILRHLSPIRPGRHSPRNMFVKHAVSFTYRIA